MTDRSTTARRLLRLVPWVGVVAVVVVVAVIVFRSRGIGPGSIASAPWERPEWAAFEARGDSIKVLTRAVASLEHARDSAVAVADSAEAAARSHQAHERRLAARQAETQATTAFLVRRLVTDSVRADSVLDAFALERQVYEQRIDDQAAALDAFAHALQAERAARLATDSALAATRAALVLETTQRRQAERWVTWSKAALAASAVWITYDALRGN